jgi:hypothetical protein
MATEEQARRARDLHQDKLAAMGAHGLSVEPLQKTDAKGLFGVVAWVKPEVAKKQAGFPSALEIPYRGRTLKVPLAIRESKPFRLE